MKKLSKWYRETARIIFQWLGEIREWCNQEISWFYPVWINWDLHEWRLVSLLSKWNHQIVSNDMFKILLSIVHKHSNHQLRIRTIYFFIVIHILWQKEWFNDTWISSRQRECNTRFTSSFSYEYEKSSCISFF